MANDYSFPISYVDANELGTGQKLRAGSIDDLRELANYNHAHGHATNVIQQEFQDGLCAWNGARVTVCEWRITRPSTAHTFVDVWVEASATVAAGTVHFNSVVGAATINAPVPVGAAAWINVGSLNVTLVGTESIQMDLEAGVGGTITIERVMCRYQPLASPLAAAKVGGFTPFGSGYGVADRALPSYFGKTMLEGLDDLLGRSRTITAWSGLSNIQAYQPNAKATLSPDYRGFIVVTSQGASDQGVTYNLVVRSQGDALVTTYIKPLFRIDGQWTWFGDYLAIAPLAALAWRTLTIEIPESKSLGAALPSYSAIPMCLQVQDDSETDYNSLVYGYSLHGF
jgi:hypothetical protein